MEMLLCHLFGDYILQSDWMAQNKTKSSFAAASHAATYTLPFLFLTWSPPALVVIIGTHFLIDRFRLARFIVYAKNFIAPRRERRRTASDNKDDYVAGLRYVFSWENCKATGYPSETPPFMAVWLLIFADNTLHLFINFLALRYL